MNPSLPSLVRQLLANPQHLQLLHRSIAHIPELASSVESLQANHDEQSWLQWFVLAEKQAPDLVPNLLRALQFQDHDGVGEETSQEHLSAGLSAPGTLTDPRPGSKGLAWHTLPLGTNTSSQGTDEEGEQTMMEPNTVSTGNALSPSTPGIPIAPPPPPRPAPPINRSVPSISALFSTAPSVPSAIPSSSSTSLPDLASITPKTPSPSSLSGDSNPAMPLVPSTPFTLSQPQELTEAPSIPPPISSPSLPSTPPTPQASPKMPSTPAMPSISSQPPQPPQPPARAPSAKLSLLSTTMSVPMYAANVMSSEEKKNAAVQNTQRVYSSGVGWHRFQFHARTGEVLPEDVDLPDSRWMHCRLETTDDGPVIREMHIHLSEQKILVYRNLIWYWQAGSSEEELTRAGINDIAAEFPADVVDLLLDLVSPGLFDHAADAHLSYSYAQAIVPEKPALSGNDAESTFSGASYSADGEQAILSQSPFAMRPVSLDDADTTMMRKAILEPLHASPKPKELTIQAELSPGWLQRWLDRWRRPRPPQRQTLAVLQVNQDYTLSDWGLTITFIIESTSKSTFPWVRVVRESQPHRDAHITLQWNQEQHQILPPGFQSTGALSRSTEIGTLRITFQKPGNAPSSLYIRWS